MHVDMLEVPVERKTSRLHPALDPSNLFDPERVTWIVNQVWPEYSAVICTGTTLVGSVADAGSNFVYRRKAVVASVGCGTGGEDTLAAIELGGGWVEWREGICRDRTGKAESDCEEKQQEELRE